MMRDPVNFRDLGGTPVLKGRIAPRTLFRGAGLHLLEAARLRRLGTEFGIRGIVDLRSEREAAMDGTAPVSAAQSLYRIPLGTAIRDLSQIPVDDLLAVTYGHLLDECSADLVDALRTVTRGLAAGGVLIACTAGKDRTGVLVAALLGLLGATPEVIVADYHRSDAAFANIMELYGSSPSAEAALSLLPPEVHHAPAHAMERLLDHVSSTWGGWDRWAGESGMTDCEVEQLRSALVHIP
ncbi:tyrosine-protein phosphatase [Streptomyces sp. NPDC060223]|uniref:tyrosine-protein phosphatase n=1 Tax=unclassified Streptomyces TaxID=2593676 RepID=UPI0036333373